jgi:hypothetical protein
LWAPEVGDPGISGNTRPGEHHHPSGPGDEVGGPFDRLILGGRPTSDTAVVFVNLVGVGCRMPVVHTDDVSSWVSLTEMSEELEPRHYTDRELTLSGISVTFHRARSVQRELTGPSTWGQPEFDSEAAPADGDADLAEANGNGNGDGHERRSGIEEALGLDDSDGPDLPNPFVTDANLRHYLDLAGAHQGAATGLLRMVKALGRGDQARYNAAIVHALHQLDHRTRYQQKTITRLEAELASARRALAALEPFEP